ncbi:hypothetical protein DRI50_12270 [candidate division KSB1 bacterium]|nr:MAG: hypothetical protein DRI50_12270 [candidate division KSB1 bacterium]
MNNPGYMFFRTYKKRSGVLSVIFLILAFLAKWYAGPFWHIADAYLGDFFIVASLYFCLSLILPGVGRTKKIVAVAALAVVVELFQATGIPRSLHLPKPFEFILGTRFDVKDFISYLAGLMLAAAVDQRASLKKKENDEDF